MAEFDHAGREALTFHLLLAFAPGEAPDEGFVEERRYDFEKAVRMSVGDALGRPFELEKIRFLHHADQLELYITVTTSLQLISNTRGFNEAAALLARHLQGFSHRTFGGRADRSTAAWHQGPVLIRSQLEKSAFGVVRDSLRTPAGVAVVAGVALLAVGFFAWGRREPAPATARPLPAYELRLDEKSGTLWRLETGTGRLWQVQDGKMTAVTPE